MIKPIVLDLSNHIFQAFYSGDNCTCEIFLILTKFSLFSASFGAFLPFFYLFSLFQSYCSLSWKNCALALMPNNMHCSSIILYILYNSTNFFFTKITLRQSSLSLGLWISISEVCVYFHWMKFLCLLMLVLSFLEHVLYKMFWSC